MTTKLFLLTLLTLLLWWPANCQNFNRPYPDGLFPYEYQELENLSNGYVVATPMKLFSSPTSPNFLSPYPVIYDPQGYIAWYSKPNVGMALDFKYFEQADKYVYTFIKQGNVNGLVLDGQFNILDTLSTFDAYDVHDVQLAANGNWLITTAYFDTMDLSAFTFDGTQGGVQTVVKGFGYEEIDPSGNLVGSYNSNSNVHPTETYDFWGYNVNSFDYCHGNAIEEDTDGNFLLSHRHLNSIHKIDRATGDIIWRLGGEISDFTFVNDTGFSGQHDIRRLNNGNYSIFDNGNMSGVTRSVSYSLDTINWTATKVDEYIHPIGATSTAMGSFQTCDDGIEVLGYGLIYRPDPSATIIDENQNRLGDYYFQDSVVSYRFLRYDLTLPARPEISCNWNGSNWELLVSGNYTDYAWSTGANTNSIVITQPGTYQVWVDQGAGMLGSLPLIISDMNNPCSVGLEELAQKDGDFEYYNLLGVKIENPQTNTVYLKVYESGKIEKLVFTMK